MLLLDDLERRTKECNVSHTVWRIRGRAPSRLRRAERGTDERDQGRLCRGQRAQDVLRGPWRRPAAGPAARRSYDGRRYGIDLAVHAGSGVLDRAEWLLAMVPPFLDAPTPEAGPSAGGGT